MPIPSELFGLTQWVLWKSEHRGGAKPTKVPYSAHTGYPADITNPANYASYEQVINGHAVGFNGQGIVATDEDEYTYFDLDDPYSDVVNGVLIELPQGDPRAESIRLSHMRIVEYLNSYTEWSPSGRGLRIIIKGKLPREWRNRIGKVEIYSRDRFLTLTGNHLAGTPTTIEPRQSQLEDVAKALGLDKGNTGTEYESKPQTREDQAVVDAIAASAVGQQFTFLFNGGDTGEGKSEVDLALANFICFFTDNKEQAERIFRGSRHYQGRTKLHTRSDLVSRLINKGFDQKPPPLDIGALRKTADALAKSGPQIHPEPQAVTPPPGMMGLIAEYLFQSAPRAMPEAALAGAIGLMGGLAGRAFNTFTGSGLNQYVVMVAPSSYGKDHIANGMSKLIYAVEPMIPAARTYLGPQHIASASALYKTFGKDKGKSQSFVSVIPEFGEWLEIHTDMRASANEKMLMRAFLDIYSKSGRGSQAGAMIYSDNDKNVAAIESPAFSFIGDTVPGSFYRASTPEAITKGLIARMFILEYKGDIPSLNFSAAHVQPTTDLLNMLANFIHACTENNQKNAPTIVPLDPEANSLFADFNAFCEGEIRRHKGTDREELTGAVWGRAWLKALKLASLVAVGCHWYDPRVIAENATWAIDMTKRDAHTLLGKLDSGEIASGSVSDARHRLILSYFAAAVQKPLPASYKVPPQMSAVGIVPGRYLWGKAKANNNFKGDNRGERKRFDDTMKELIDMKVIRKVENHEPSVQPWVQPNCEVDWYVVVDATLLTQGS